MKKKIAALLRRWAYALNPDPRRHFRRATKSPKVVSQISHPIQGGMMPPKEVVNDYCDSLTKEVLERVKDFGYIRYRADISPVPGGLIEYEASLYVGFIPKNKTK